MWQCCGQRRESDVFEVIYDHYLERWNLYLIMFPRNVRIPDEIANSCVVKFTNLRNLRRFCSANSCAHGLEKRTVSWRNPNYTGQNTPGYLRNYGLCFICQELRQVIGRTFYICPHNDYQQRRNIAEVITKFIVWSYIFHFRTTDVPQRNTY